MIVGQLSLAYALVLELKMTDRYKDDSEQKTVLKRYSNLIKKHMKMLTVKQKARVYEMASYLCELEKKEDANAVL